MCFCKSMLLNSDIVMIFIVQAVLLLFAFYAVYQDLRIRKLNRKAPLLAETRRGDKSMNALYTVYAATIVSNLVLIDNAVGFDGHKVVLITIAFICLTYAFFFSTWFRNVVFSPLQRRLRMD